MAEITLRTLANAGLIFSFFILGVFALITIVDKGVDGSGGADSASGFIQQDELKEFNRSFGIANNLTQSINSIKTKVVGLNVERTDNIFSISLAFINGGWEGFKTLLGMFGFVSSITTGMLAWFGVSQLGFVLNIIEAFLAIILIFVVFNYVFGRQNE